MTRKRHRLRTRAMGAGAGPCTSTSPAIGGLAPPGHGRELRARLARFAFVERVDPDERAARERRVAELAPIGELPLEEGVDVVACRQRDRRVLGVPGLHEDPPGHVAAAGAPRDLDEELEGALARPEVGDAERRVGVDDADERHVRQVVPLGDHLRPDEDVDLARAHPRQDRLDAAAAGHVAVEPRDARHRERRGERLLELLRADALELQRVGVALGAAHAERRLEVAVVAADDGPRPLVERERHRARVARRPRGRRPGSARSGAKPRRFRKRMTCSRASSAPSMARYSGMLMRLSPVGPGPVRRRSMSSTRGIGCDRARSGRRSLIARPVRVSCSLSSEGVALPRTHTPPARCARQMAMSRAW